MHLNFVRVDSQLHLPRPNLLLFEFFASDVSYGFLKIFTVHILLRI